MTQIAIHADVHLVPIDAVHPNEYNPNEMTEEEFGHLVQDITLYGFVGAIKVRPDGAIVDGEHRWRAAKQLGMAEIPVTFVDCDELTARVLTVRWDKEHGSFNPVKLAENLHYLGKHYGDKELARLTGFRETELQDYRRLLQLPPELQAAVEAQAEADEGKMPRVLHFVVTKDEAELVEAEVTRLARKRRGEALVAMAKGSRAFAKFVDTYPILQTDAGRSSEITQISQMEEEGQRAGGEGTAGLESHPEERA